MYKLIAYVLFMGWSASLAAQRVHHKLQRQLTAACAGFGGQVGFYVLDLKTGKTASFNADTVFPTASIVKLPILLGVMDKLEKGTLSYHQKLVYKDSLLYEGEDILGSFKNDEPIELSKVMMLMLTTSDNTASLWLQSLAGGGQAVNALLSEAGYTHTRINSRTPNRDSARKQFGWGQTTPQEMAMLMNGIVNNTLISSNASQKMLKLLGRNYWDEEGLSAIPAGVFVASKNGAVNASRSELMYVNGKRRPYILSIFTKNNTDQSWTPQNEAWVLTRKVSALVWQYFNP